MLSLLFLNPLIVSILLMIVPSNLKDHSPKGGALKESYSAMYKQIPFISSIFNFIVALILWVRFDGNCYEYQFVEEWIFIKNYYLHVGVDGISLFFIILTTFIIPIVIFSSWSSIKKNWMFYMISFLILEAILIAVFIVLDLIFFYITFESCLIPMFLIIGIWGSRQRKILASSYFFLYTLFGSLFMFLCIIFMYSIIGTLDFKIISSTDWTFETQQIIWLGFLLALAIKTPMIPFHLWLPEAHTEAPLGGSVILAGILLKLASYGFLRVCLQFLPDASIFFTPLILNLAIFSIILSSFTTFRQIDLKRMIAYSSIGHMGIINLGIFSNTIQGIEGAMILSIMHGIVSPALFICVSVLYDRYHVRLIKFYKGLTSKMPMFSLFFFIFILGNMAVPLTGNFIGEFLSFTGIFYKNPLFTTLAASSMILVAGYSIWVFNRIAFGSESRFILKAKDLTRREFSVLSILVFLTFYFGINPNIILDPIHFSISFLLIDYADIYSIHTDLNENLYILSFFFFSNTPSRVTFPKGEIKIKIKNFIFMKILPTLFNFHKWLILPFLTVYIPLNLFAYDFSLIQFIYLFIPLLFLLYYCNIYYKKKLDSFMKVYNVILSFFMFLIIILQILNLIDYKHLMTSISFILTFESVLYNNHFENSDNINLNKKIKEMSIRDSKVTSSLTASNNSFPIASPLEESNDKNTFLEESSDSDRRKSLLSFFANAELNNKNIKFSDDNELIHSNEGDEEITGIPAPTSIKRITYSDRSDDLSNEKVKRKNKSAEDETCPSSVENLNENIFYITPSMSNSISNEMAILDNIYNKYYIDQNFIKHKIIESKYFFNDPEGYEIYLKNENESIKTWGISFLECEHLNSKIKKLMLVKMKEKLVEYNLKSEILGYPDYSAGGKLHITLKNGIQLHCSCNYCKLDLQKIFHVIKGPSSNEYPLIDPKIIKNDNIQEKMNDLNDVFKYPSLGQAKVTGGKDYYLIFKQVIDETKIIKLKVKNNSTFNLTESQTIDFMSHMINIVFKDIVDWDKNWNQFISFKILENYNIKFSSLDSSQIITLKTLKDLSYDVINLPYYLSIKSHMKIIHNEDIDFIKLYEKVVKITDILPKEEKISQNVLANQIIKNHITFPAVEKGDTILLDWYYIFAKNNNYFPSPEGYSNPDGRNADNLNHIMMPTAEQENTSSLELCHKLSYEELKYLFFKAISSDSTLRESYSNFIKTFQFNTQEIQTFDQQNESLQEESSDSYDNSLGQPEDINRTNR